MQGAQNAVTPQGRPIIQLNPANQFPSTKNASFYIHEVPGSIDEAVDFGPTFGDVDVGVPRPISRETLTTRYKENLEYVRREIERANLSEQKVLFTQVAEDGSRKSVGRLVDGAEVGKNTFIAFVSNDVLTKHGVDYNVQGGVSFSLGASPSPGINPFVDRVRSMMVDSGVVQAKTEAYEQMMQADNFIFVNSRRLVADAGPMAALKTTLHEIGHAFSTKSGAKDEQLSQNVVKAYNESGATGAVSALKKQVIGHALEEARAETFALGVLGRQGLAQEFITSTIDSSRSKSFQTRRLLSYSERSAFKGYTDRYLKKIENAIENRGGSLSSMLEVQKAVSESAEEIATQAHAALHQNVIIPREIEEAFEPLRRRLVSNTYHQLKGKVQNSSVDLEGELSSIKELMKEMDEDEIQEMLEEFGVSSKEELEAMMQNAVPNQKVSPAAGYSKAMTPVLGEPVESLPRYVGGIDADTENTIQRFAVSMQQNPNQNPETVAIFKKALVDQGIDESRLNEIIAHSTLSKQSQLPSLANDAGGAAIAVIQSSKQVSSQGLEDGLGFAASGLNKRASRNCI